MRLTLTIVILAALMSSCGQVTWSNGFRVCEKTLQGCAAASSAISEVTCFWNGHEEDCVVGEDQKPVTKNIAHKNHEGVVEVVMKVDQKGQWKVVNMAATNEELAKYVLSKLKEYNLQANSKSVGQVVKYRFVFKKQA
jgi:hypothetical protein